MNRRSSRPPGRSGILVVDKAIGSTSFDVVAAVRRAIGIRRVGHAGTLDPGATGVLPILIEEATKLTPYLVDQDKEYLATVRFGVTTDTHDLAGRVTGTAPVPALSGEGVERACRAFVGHIRQTPPMYSAVHHGGRRLYELAREGVEVPREAREVIVHSIVVEAVGPASATLRIVCGKGTYVRALARDLGAALGCGAAVERLVRARVGRFRLDEAVASGEITTANAGELWSRVLPPEAALLDWPAASLAAGAARAFLNGQLAEGREPGSGPGRLVRVHDGEGHFLGVGERVGGGRGVKPLRILHADQSRARRLPV
ncbi:MAG: tRNA pseudouridine(55) synthase TruB [Candidatus Rokubacteria bacterium]|nr:tRNA pseudouridine(55) synthase TruB [Candidatus Rokubacteria bacterium]